MADHREDGGLSALQVLTLADAVIAAATLAALGRRHVPDASAPERPGLGVVATVGILAGILLFGALLAGFLDTTERIERDRTHDAMQETAWDLLETAERHLRHMGSYPREVAGLLSTGAIVPPGAQVEFAGTFADGFCIIVGQEMGEALSARPVFTGFTWPGARTGDHVVRKGRSCQLASMRARGGDP